MKELVIEVKQCSSMGLNLKNHGKAWIKLDADNKINMGDIYSIAEEKVICKSTGKPCLLYDKEGDIFGTQHIDYSRLDWCPSIAKGNSEEVVIKYNLKGLKDEYVFYVLNLERIEE